MSEQMRAAVLHAPGKLVVEQVAVPEIGPDDVLLRVSACGVCGSDIPRVLTTGTYHFPTIPGHEFGGRVVKTGKHVEPSLVGRRAAVIPLIPCRKCSMCEVGAFALCEAYDFLGSRSDGGFAEYVRVPAQNLVFVPDEVDDDSTAFLEPISVALHVIENCGVSYGDTVAVYGLGAIGVFVAQWAKVFGAKTVYAVDLDPKKIEVANQLGLYGVNSAETDAEAFLKAQGGVDRVFEASGAPAVFNQALRVLRPSGVLGLVRPNRWKSRGMPMKNCCAGSSPSRGLGALSSSGSPNMRGRPASRRCAPAKSRPHRLSPTVCRSKKRSTRSN